jgi:hypothetical protein
MVFFTKFSIPPLHLVADLGKILSKREAEKEQQNTKRFKQVM